LRKVPPPYSGSAAGLFNSRGWFCENGLVEQFVNSIDQNVDAGEMYASSFLR
jgi:hypothetical protein